MIIFKKVYFINPYGFLTQSMLPSLFSQWTPQHEKKFLATLSALKGRDPKIYNKNEVIFGDVQNIGDEGNSQENIDGAKVLAKGSKEKQPSGEGKAKMTLKDYERKIIAEEGL